MLKYFIFNFFSLFNQKIKAFIKTMNGPTFKAIVI